MNIGTPFARARKSGLYFIKNQDNTVFGAEFTQPLDIGLWRDVESALTLHQFKDNSGNVLGINMCCDKTLKLGQFLL